MKRALLILFAITSCAAAEEVPDEGVLVSPRERAYIVKKMMKMQQQIDDLEKALQTEKERTACA